MRRRPALQLGDQLEDLLLHGDVERAGRLVGDQKLRLAGDRHGDHHPLLLAAGELVGIAVDLLRGQAHLVQELENAPAHA
jgi:hypothetical protein